MSFQVLDPNTVHESVRAHYGERARNADSCCGGGSCDTIDLYADADLSALPSEVAGFTLGCGNPTAIAGLQPGEVVVDFGSGGGLDVLLAARQVGPSGFVYGVDMTDDMLALARRNAAKAGATNVEFRKGNIEDLPLDDDSVDVIISNCVINLSPDKSQTLGEAFRVLRRGGRVAVSDIVVEGDLRDLPVSEEQVRTALSWAGCIAGALTMDQYRTVLAEAGFTDIRIDVRGRYSKEALAGVDAAQVAALNLDDALLDQVANRFTSSSITATKP